MLKLDEFESVFRSADKRRYQHHSVDLRSVLVVTDREKDDGRRFSEDVRTFLGALGSDLRWIVLSVAAYRGVGELLEAIEGDKPDLICTHRNLCGHAGAFPYSLGSFVDVLTQATPIPVLLLPNPTVDAHLPPQCTAPTRVMVLTNDLTSQDRLVDFGVRVTPQGGNLFLVHLEDDVVFERYVNVISKIPSIDTQDATEAIREQLLKEPRDYIASCREELAEAEAHMAVHEILEMGHRVATCKRLMDQHAVGLVVMNTKDEEQLAMHGLAYALAVELREHPLLLL